MNSNVGTLASRESNIYIDVIMNRRILLIVHRYKKYDYQEILQVKFLSQNTCSIQNKLLNYHVLSRFKLGL